MMAGKFLRSLAMTTALFGLAGCQSAAVKSLQAQSRVDPRSVGMLRQTVSCGEGTRLRGDFAYGAINLDCLTIPVLRADGITEYRHLYPMAAQDAVYRNRLAAILTGQSDQICTIEMGKLIANEAMVNTGFGFATSALSALGTLVTGDFAKSALAAGAGLSNATRDHVNAEVYRNALATAVTKAIRGERKTLRDGIQLKLAGTIDSYSVDAMVTEVNQYHQTCSFFRGLELVVEAVERQGIPGARERMAYTVQLSELDAEIAKFDRLMAAGGGRSVTNRRTGAVTRVDADPSYDSWKSMRDALIAKRQEIVIARSAIPASASEPVPQAPTATVPDNPGG